MIMQSLCEACDRRIIANEYLDLVAVDVEFSVILEASRGRVLPGKAGKLLKPLVGALFLASGVHACFGVAFVKGAAGETCFICFRMAHANAPHGGI